MEKVNAMNPVRIIDLFAGIGGFRLAAESVGARCVFSSEINAAARRTYEANFGDRPIGNIRLVDASLVPAHDLLLGGFPCQTFSIAGVSKLNSLGRPSGLLDETRGTLFFEIARLLSSARPRAFVLENVKNLLHHDSGRTLDVILSTLDRLGYHTFYRVLDASHWVPQQRKRIFIVGFESVQMLKDFIQRFEAAFQLDLFQHRKPRLSDILETSVSDQYTLQDGTWSYLQYHAAKHREAGNGFGFKGFADPDGLARTLTARYGRDGAEILIEQPGRNPRRLTPRECARLMGYPDSFRFPVSDSEAYRQLGNSVVVPLVRDLLRVVVGVLRGESVKIRGAG